MSSKAGKRPLRSLTAHEKLGAIRRVHAGESKAAVARDIGVPESTLRGWCKNEDKISYLSRQSSPDTDESAPGIEPPEKKPKLEDVLQPYNLSKKTNGSSHSPGSDFVKNNDFDASKPLNLNVKTEREKDRNRAELARLSRELGLNRPEMFMPNVNSGNSLCDLSNNVGLLMAQWNNLLLQQHQRGQNTINKVTAPADTSSSYPAVVEPALPKVEIEHKPRHSKPPKMEKPLDESVMYWLKTQPSSMLGLMQNQNGVPVVPSVSSTSSTPSVTTSSFNTYESPNSSMFWRWYREFTDCYPFQQHNLEKPILYQQLTKDKDSHNTENIHTEEKPAVKNNIKARAVLDNLLFNNNNNLGLEKRDVNDEILSQREALRHGELFLKWLECCRVPTITTMQILQFRFLLDKIKNGADRRNGELRNKAKVKRK